MTPPDNRRPVALIHHSPPLADIQEQIIGHPGEDVRGSGVGSDVDPEGTLTDVLSDLICV